MGCLKRWSFNLASQCDELGQVIDVYKNKILKASLKSWLPFPRCRPWLRPGFKAQQIGDCRRIGTRLHGGAWLEKTHRGRLFKKK
jgi:hypothetical protein